LPTLRREDVAHGLVDPAVDAECQAVAGRGDLVDDRVEAVGVPAHELGAATNRPSVTSEF
jgi:hypothetical protein